ncbi:MAG: hypothetical protein U5K99_06755 [Anaerolineales bacterium]|nr:hypothetical protein [Anaerolineales bacterium]
MTLEITGGALSISVPAGVVDFGTISDTVEGGTISAQLGEVQVSDARSAPAGSGWVASVISTAFTPAAGPTIAASAISYDAGTITKVGTATYTANNPVDLTGSVPAVTATGITGNNSATWNPTITVAVPGGMAAGDLHCHDHPFGPVAPCRPRGWLAVLISCNMKALLAKKQFKGCNRMVFK